jgi:rod shape-determining protein MreD
MARILFGLLLVVAALIQATILPRVNPVSVFPDLVLVFLFMWSASRSIRESLFWVFFAGILLDVLALDYFGTNALALVVVVVLAGLPRQRVLTSNLLIPMLLVVVATVLHGIALALLRGDSPMGWFIPLQALLHALLIPIIYLALRAIGR